MRQRPPSRRQPLGGISKIAGQIASSLVVAVLRCAVAGAGPTVLCLLIARSGWICRRPGATWTEPQHRRFRRCDHGPARAIVKACT